MPNQETIAVEMPCLETAVASVCESVDRAMANGITMTEAMTETIVVDPLLRALGYALWDYQKQGVAEGIGNIPDYTILPHTPQQWFLEVKKWKLNLTDREASQAVTYAHNQGKRWAVLTNGDEWRIYDAHSHVPLAEKCILTIPTLSSPQAIEALQLLSKAAMLTGQLDSTHRAKLVMAAVRNELTNIHSQTIKTLRKVIESPQLPSISKDEVFAALAQLCLTGVPSSHVPLAQAVTPPVQHSEGEQPIETVGCFECTIDDFVKNHPAPSYKKVHAILFPDGVTVPTDNWSAVTREVVQWCATHYGLPPLPFMNGSQGHTDRYFLNTSPVHADGKAWRVEGRISTGDGQVYVYLHNSAKGFCRVLHSLMQAIHVDPATVRIRVSEASQE